MLYLGKLEYLWGKKDPVKKTWYLYRHWFDLDALRI
jgi:hypothetical protein